MLFIRTENFLPTPTQRTFLRRINFLGEDVSRSTVSPESSSQNLTYISLAQTTFSESDRPTKHIRVPRPWPRFAPSFSTIISFSHRSSLLQLRSSPISKHPLALPSRSGRISWHRSAVLVAHSCAIIFFSCSFC